MQPQLSALIFRDGKQDVYTFNEKKLGKYQETYPGLILLPNYTPAQAATGIEKTATLQAGSYGVEKPKRVPVKKPVPVAARPDLPKPAPGVATNIKNLKQAAQDRQRPVVNITHGTYHVSVKEAAIAVGGHGTTISKLLRLRESPVYYKGCEFRQATSAEGETGEVER